MKIIRSETWSLQDAEDVNYVRRAVRTWAQELSFSMVDQTKLVTAASELARNTVDHGGGGTLCMEVIEKEGRKGLRLIFEDQGPGITDVHLAQKDGYSTTAGLGLGLGGSKRLLSEFDISSRLGEGTRVTAIKWS